MDRHAIRILGHKYRARTCLSKPELERRHRLSLRWSTVYMTLADILLADEYRAISVGRLAGAVAAQISALSGFSGMALKTAL